ncbi:MAG TPA: papain-like cysteine protease family protein [Hyalangium sp.]|nr:papain-like cysteine protease family protein [Hyalangium sp.]
MSVNLRPAADPSRAVSQGNRQAPEKPKAEPQAQDGAQSAAAEPSSKEGPQARGGFPGFAKGGFRSERGSPFGQKEQKGWGPPHHINQLTPKGADENYKNALFNCGPAVIAMLAKSSGNFKDMTDAQLVSELGSGLVTDKGTTSEGITKMMERADLPLAGDALGAGYSEKDLQDQLKQGNKLVAQVRSTNPQAQADSAHYVVIEGMTRDGNYVISDPLAKGPYAVKPDQLKEAVLKAPPDGGMLIPVGAPGAKSVEAAAPAGTPGAPSAAVTAPKPSDGFSDPDLRAIEARRVTDPNGIRVSDVMARAGAVDPSTVAVAGRVSNALGLPVAGLTTCLGNEADASIGELINAGEGLAKTLGGAVSLDGTAAEGVGYELPQTAFVGPRAAVAQPAVAQPAGPATTPPAANPDTTATPSAPLILNDPTVKVAKEGEAFTVSDAELAKVDGTFTETANKPTDSRLVENDQKNDFKLDVNYGRGDDKAKPAAKAKDKGPVADEKMSIGDFIRKLLGLKEKGDEKAYDILGDLEHSKHGRDQQVLNKFKHKDKHDPGTGSRRWGDDFGG